MPATAEHYALMGYDITRVYGARKAQDLIIEFCQENRMECLDLTPVLELLARTAYLEIDGHWTEEGNRIVADGLLKWFRTNMLAIAYEGN